MSLRKIMLMLIFLLVSITAFGQKKSYYDDDFYTTISFVDRYKNTEEATLTRHLLYEMLGLEDKMIDLKRTVDVITDQRVKNQVEELIMLLSRSSLNDLWYHFYPKPCELWSVAYISRTDKDKRYLVLIYVGYDGKDMGEFRAYQYK